MHIDTNTATIVITDENACGMLSERIYIVGVMAHDVAVSVAVKVAYREPLHLLEHLIAYGFLNAL